MNILMRKRGFTLVELFFVFLAAAFVFVLMLPGIKAIHNYKVKSTCAGNLRQIGMAMYIYAQEHDGSFPPDIRTLYQEKYLTDKKILDCPANSKKGTLENGDYFYTGGLSINSPSWAPLVRDKKGNHSSGGKNILYVNGQIKWKE
jgi:competence protein ComGC